MKVLIFNHHPDCTLYMYKAFKQLGAEVELATENLTLAVGFQYSSTKQNKLEVVNKLFTPEEFSEEFKEVVFTNKLNHDIYLSFLPEIYNIAGNKAYFDARMQSFMRRLGGLPIRKSCNHPDAEQFGFKFCSNWVPHQTRLIEPKYITQLITQSHLVEETTELIKLKEKGLPVIIAGKDTLPDGFIRDRDILPYTSLLVHNKNFGINCYAVCKALDTGIPVYMSKETKKTIGFGDLPDSLFLFKDDLSVEDAYKVSLNTDKKYIQDTYRSLYTLNRTVRTLLECLK